MMSCFYARSCVLNLFFECGNEAKEEKLKRKSTVLVKSSSLVVEK